MSFGIVIPVKPAGRAKSRLSSLGDAVRRDLAVAFAADTMRAVLECDLVAHVLVVTDDPDLARELADSGVLAIPDGAAELNESLRQATAELLRRHPQVRPAALLADLPALRGPDLEAALRAAGDGPAFVADADHEGSTLVIGRVGEPLTTHFGPRSREAHLAAGYEEIGLDLPTLKRDVDTAADLAVALELGVGPRTSYIVTLHRL